MTPAAPLTEMPDDWGLPEGIDPEDVVIPSYEDMTREELIEACKAHDEHHQWHHDQLDTPKPYTDRERMLAEALVVVNSAASAMSNEPIKTARRTYAPALALAAEIMNTQQEKV